MSLISHCEDMSHLADIFEIVRFMGNSVAPENFAFTPDN